MKWLIYTGNLNVKDNTKDMYNYEIPKYSTCDLGKGNHKSDQIKKINKYTMKEKELNKNHLFTEQMVSTNMINRRWCYNC